MSVDFTPSKLNRLVVADLRSLCEERHLDSAGLKKDLVARLVEWHEKSEAAPSTENTGKEGVGACLVLGCSYPR